MHGAINDHQHRVPLSIDNATLECTSVTRNQPDGWTATVWQYCAQHSSCGKQWKYKQSVHKITEKQANYLISQHRELTFYPKNATDAQKLELVWYFTYSVSSSQLTSRMGSARAWHGGPGGWWFFVHCVHDRLVCSSSSIETVSYTHLTLPTNREV